jgi:integrase
VKRARKQFGSVSLDPRWRVWNFRWRTAAGKRHSRVIGSIRDYRTRSAAWAAVAQIDTQPPQPRPCTVAELVEAYRQEKMPERFSTRRGYNSWLNNHVVMKWGDQPITALQPRAVDLWLKSLPLAPKSKVHIRGLVRALWEHAMYSNHVPTARNPMELVTIKGASKRKRKPRSLTPEQFQALRRVLANDPCWSTMLLVAISFGLRISELLGLKWGDIDWLEKTLSIKRGIVKQIVDTVKTEDSAMAMPIADELLDVLKQWKQVTQFSSPDDWMFASTVKLGRLPLSYTHVWETLTAAAKQAGIAHISSHIFRHTHRSWLDSVGTTIGVQKQMMRHSDIRTTMNIYGAAATADMREAHRKVVGLALMD